MLIEIPIRVTYGELKSLLGQFYDRTVDASVDERVFDWTKTSWATLPELALILSWSSRVVHLGKTVKWILPDPRTRPSQLDNVRFNAQLALGKQLYDDVAREFEQLRQKSLRDGLFPRQRRAALERIRSKACQNRKIAVVDHWIDLEAGPLECMDLLGYLDRYNFFQCAADSGITMQPNPRSLPKASFERSIETPCLAFVPIQSLPEVDSVVQRLCDPAEIERVLGRYAQLDVVRRGALSQILVNELGRNVGEHSGASGAWLCTRLVPPESIAVQTANDPALRSLHQHSEGFLEVIVCDDGHGLAVGLDDVLEQDQRAAVRHRYSKRDGVFPLADLVDYAFDRLSSTKRNIADLVHLSEKSDTALVASGLYWIWNVVRSYHGVLSVRTGSVCGWYDFNDTGQHEAPAWKTSRLETDSSTGPFPGTMIRLCLPLAPDLLSERMTAARHAIHLPNSSTEGPRDIKVSWVGNFARRSSLRRTRGKSKEPTQLYLNGVAAKPQTSILQDLQREHFPLKDGDILLLDLAGTRLLWDQSSAATLCHFFLEMNYTSTVGRSAVVLWNVPRSVEKLFETAIEDFVRRYAKLDEFRRAAFLVRDDGKARVFCGWPEAEKVLGQLLYEGESDLDESGTRDLSSDDVGRLRRLVTENSHLFEWVATDRVRLRTWPPHLRAVAWDNEVRWLETVVNVDVVHGGALRRLERGYYRLPSTGWLVKDFYSFGGLVSNQEACARIAWLLNQVITSIETKHGATAGYLVSVTRPVITLGRHLRENYLLERDVPPRLLWGSTIEELEAKGREEDARGSAVLITDVVSSGFLCDQVRRALPNLTWLGTAAIIDTAQSPLGSMTDESIELNFGITCRRTRRAATGDIYALAVRCVEKVDPAKVVGEPVIAIDRVNVCPIEPPDPEAQIGEPVWPYLDRRPQALQVGHYHAGDLHHYVYYVNAQELIEATHPESELRLLDAIVESVVDQLDSTSYDPDRTVIMHPPRDTSYAEEIAIAVQRSTGALYRHVLHRDTFAGQRRFSSFIAHGVPLAGSTVIVIDDGSNTGETLIGLLHAAASARPARIFAHLALSRMPLHKIDLLRRITRLAGVAGKTELKFAVRLSIPVFSPRTCPVCRFGQALQHVVENSSLLRRYARLILSETESLPTGSSGSQRTRDFCWACKSPAAAARLRESIEFADYDESATSQITQALNLATSPDSASENLEALGNLGFVVCAEPELLSSPIFVPFFEPVFRAVCRHLGNASEQEFTTLMSLAFHCMVHLSTKADVDPNELARLLWAAALQRTGLSIPAMGRFFASCLADTERGIGSEKAERRRVCCACATAFVAELARREHGPPDIVRAMGKLFARELATLVAGTLGRSACTGDAEEPTLFAIASAAAGKFWWHASEHVRLHIESLRKEATQPLSSMPTVEMRGHLHALIIAFDELFQLQHGLCQVEAECDHTIGQTSGARDYWNSPQLSSALASFGEALTNVAEMVMEPISRGTGSMLTDLDLLSLAWQELYKELQPAFSEILPKVGEVVDAAWSTCEAVSGLPSSAVNPLEKDPSLPDHARCFLTRTLFSRFLRVAMENLKTSAYFSWTEAELANHASVRLVILSEQESDGSELIRVQFIDNGKMCRRQEAPAGSGRGLGDVRALAESFAARLIGPTVNGQETTVELRVRHRTTRG